MRFRDIFSGLPQCFLTISSFLYFSVVYLNMRQDVQAAGITPTYNIKWMLTYFCSRTYFSYQGLSIRDIVIYFTEIRQINVDIIFCSSY